MIGVLSDESGVKSLTTNKNTANDSSTVILSDSFSSVSGGNQYTYTPAVYIPFYIHEFQLSFLTAFYQQILA